jgi:uncharacterized protein YeaO (DUF488 family)
MEIRVKRIYDPPAKEDGVRLLVDRIWPRGLRKETAKIDGWAKSLAPSDDLRHWFGHETAKWEEFQYRYFAELDKKTDIAQTLFSGKKPGKVTLLFAARDITHNNAVALKSYLDHHPSLVN